MAALTGVGLVVGCVVGLGAQSASGATAPVTPIAMSNTGFAVHNGTLYGWGANTDGQLGDGTTTDQPSPVPVSQGAIPDGVSIVQLATSSMHTLALGSDGKVYAWGDDAGKELGDGGTTNENVPVQVALPSGVRIVKVVAAPFVSWALAADGTVYGWGFGILGDGTTTASSITATPVAVAQGQIPDGVKIVDIAASQLTKDVALLGNDGNVYVFGASNATGQLGSADTTFTAITAVATPQGAIPDGVKLIEVRAQDSGFEALGEDGAVYGWGNDGGGELGTNPPGGNASQPAPVANDQGAIPDGVTLVDIVSLAEATVALGSDGELYAWGANAAGLGDSTTTIQANAPILVSQGAIPDGVTLVALAGSDTTAAVLGDDGNVYAWGDNSVGEIGDGGDEASQNIPTRVALPGIDTRTTVSVSGQPTLGQPISLTASVIPVDAAGSVEFFDGTTSLGTAAVSGGSASLVTSSLGLGAHAITAVFTPTDSTAFTGSTSDPVTVTVAEGSLATATPSITGTARVGSMLSASPGAWTAGTSFVFQWSRNGAAIAGATAARYTPVPADAGARLTVTVTGSKDGFTPASVTSAPVTVAPGVLAAGTPSIIGTVKVGVRVSAGTGAWSPGTRLTVQWLRNGAVIGGATGSSYTPAAADAGKKLSVRVTGTLAGFTTTSRTSAGRVVAAGTLAAGTPSLAGAVKVGVRVSERAGSWSPGTRLAVQWLRNGTAIHAATGSSYTPVAADAGKRLSVRVTGTKAGFSTVSRVSAARTVAKGSLLAGTPKLTGLAKVGARLSVLPGRWSAGVHFGFAWHAAGRLVRGAHARTLRLTKALAGKKITVTVTGSKPGYLTVVRTSKPTIPVKPATARPTQAERTPTTWPTKAE